MRILVRVKTNAKRAKVEVFDQSSLPFTPSRPPIYKVWVKEPPVDGRANEAIIHALSEHFSVPHHAVRIVSGHGSTQKAVEIVGISS